MDDNTNRQLSNEIIKDLFSNNDYSEINSIPKNTNFLESKQMLSQGTNSQNNSFMSNFYNISFTNLIIMTIAFIFLLAFIGFNILIFLGKSVDEVIDIFKPFFNNFGGLFKKSVNEITFNTTKGLETTANIANKTVVGAVSGAVTGYELSKDTNNQENENMYKSNDIINSLKNNDEVSNYIADDSYSSIQMRKPNAKSGFCYIGEEKGIRSCVEVGVNDICMSGDIFPTKDICINPNLRV